MRDLTKQEKVFMIHYPKLQLSLNWAHKYQFLPYSSAYLLKENTEEEISPLDETYRDASFEHEFGNSTKALNNIYN